MTLSSQKQAPITFDIRYASKNNFTGKQIYKAPRAFLMVEALLQAAEQLKEKGCGLRILDAYRPWQLTAYFWTHYPADRLYLSDPNVGPRHNRGCAVDLTLYELASNKEIKMPSDYDEFNEKAHLNYSGDTQAEHDSRTLLQLAIALYGFESHPHEW